VLVYRTKDGAELIASAPLPHPEAARTSGHAVPPPSRVGRWLGAVLALVGAKLELQCNTRWVAAGHLALLGVRPLNPNP